MRNQIKTEIKTLSLGMLTCVGIVLAPIAMAQGGGIPRTPSGHPDLSGTYDVSTLTPMQRPTAFGDKQFLTNDEAAVIAAEELQRSIDRQQDSDPNRGAPPQGGDGSTGASGNVGGYNTFWIDRGTGAYQVDGQWRTSILIDPPDGRMPAATDEARAARRARFSAGEGAAPRREGGQNDGTAYWLHPGPMTTWNSDPLPNAAC